MKNNPNLITHCVLHYNTHAAAYAHPLPLNMSVSFRTEYVVGANKVMNAQRIMLTTEQQQKYQREICSKLVVSVCALLAALYTIHLPHPSELCQR